MATIHNEITIDAPVEKIWAILTDLALLERYDPTVMSAAIISAEKTCIGAARKVTMLDGKNWFNEQITELQPNKTLTITLTECSFPIKGLEHSYSFENSAGLTKVKQVMKYTVKFGVLGMLMDSMMIRKQSDAGIKKFFAGLKNYAEQK